MRGIHLDGDRIRASAEGSNELRGGLVILTHIHVHYELRLPAGTPEDRVERALATHVEKCSTAQTIRPAIRIDWTVDIEVDEA